MTQRTSGTLMVLASAAGFATLAIFVKYAYAAGVTTVTMLTGRFLLAALALWAVVIMRKIPIVTDKKIVIKLCLMGILGYCVVSILFTSTLYYLPASLAAMLLYAYPALVTLIAFIIGDEVFSWNKGIALVICFLGLFLVLGVSFSSLQPIGIMLGLSAALVYSVYIVVGNRVLKSINPLLATTYVCSAAGIALLVGGWAAGYQSLDFDPHGWADIFGMALLGTIVGILGLFAGMSRIGAANASIISITEPVITVILSVLLLAEELTLLQVIGGLLIIAGIIVLQVWAKEQAPYMENEQLDRI
ncbi:MAG: DMT family transporter [Veillonellaceae bacterium]|jgi:drug/metabolite transporter (DMT)-like permease|nr:DMT family transporter [Veillonellaceae bacterium]